MTRLPDRRSSHFWDGNKTLAKQFSQLLQLNEKPAWDVYLLYDGDAQWQETAPTPIFWMHQLEDVYPEKELNGVKLRKQIKQQLKNRSIGSAR